MKRLYLFVVMIVVLLMCNYVAAETVEVFFQTPGPSGKPEVKVNGVSPKLKIERSFMSISVSTLTPNPEKEASVSIEGEKIIAVSSNNCLNILVSENTVVFKCIPQIVGEIGKILMTNENQEMSFKYSTGLVIEADIHSLWSIAPLEIPLGQISNVESNGTIWVKPNPCKVKRSGNAVTLINRPGDVNLDGIVNILDLIATAKKNGALVSPEAPEDMNWNGIIDSGDLNLVIAKFGTKYMNPQAPPKPNRTITWGKIRAD